MESDKWRKNMQKPFTIPKHGRRHEKPITEAKVESVNDVRKNSRKANAA